LDYDPNSDHKGGSDGCLDVSKAENTRLINELWSSPDGTDVPFYSLYKTHFSDMSTADFWVASAYAVLRERRYPGTTTSFEFRWGRIDATTSSCNIIKGEERSPDFVNSQTGCDELETKLINRMGLDWGKVTALMGYHTLGENDNSRVWTESHRKSAKFDNQYYRDILNSGWIPQDGTNEWIYGGQSTRPVVMYPSDLCLYYVFPPTEDCCTNNLNECTNADGVELPACTKLDVLDPRRVAVDYFANGYDYTNLDYNKFYTAFAEVMQDLSSNGHGRLYTTWSDSIAVRCTDMCDGFLNSNNQTRTCVWVLARDRCPLFSRHCPVGCGLHNEGFFPEKCHFEGLTPNTQPQCS